MADEVWHVGVRGERKGPFTEETIKEMIQRGEVTATDVVWKEGMDEWEPAEQVEPFAEAVRSAPPPPPAAPAAAAGPNVFAEYFKGLWKELRGILDDPDNGLAVAAENKNLSHNITWLAVGVVIFSLLCLQGYIAIALVGPERIVPAPAGVGVHAVITQSGSQLATLGKGILHGVVLYAVWFGVLMATLIPVLKTQATWQDAMSILALSTIPIAAMGLVTFAFAWIDPWFMVLLYLGAIANAIFYFRVFCHVSRVSTRAAIYAVPATYFVALLVYNVIRLGLK